MASVPPKKRTVADLKNSILKTSLTTHYECNFSPPKSVQDIFTDRGDANPGMDEYYTIACAEASLPGTSLATVELQNDHSGITERHVHRRQYDTTASFTFYVDTSYKVIKLFESWIGYIVNEQNKENPNYFYRVNYPDQYQTSIYITKFERDYHIPQSSPMELTYEYLNAYPISIDAMPVSYEGAQTLKCTVNFNFSRYILKPTNLSDISEKYQLFDGQDTVPEGSFNITGQGDNRNPNRHSASNQITDVNALRVMDPDFLRFIK